MYIPVTFNNWHHSATTTANSGTFSSPPRKRPTPFSSLLNPSSLPAKRCGESPHLLLFWTCLFSTSPLNGITHICIWQNVRFLCLDSFTQPEVSKTHPYWIMNQYFALFLWLDNSPLWGYDIFCVLTQQLMDSGVVSTGQLLWIMLPWTRMYKLYVDMFLMSVRYIHRREIPGSFGDPETAQLFPKGAMPFYILYSRRCEVVTSIAFQSNLIGF